MVVNMNMHSEKEGNINEYLSDTIASVFDYVYTVDVRGSTNRELFASMNGDCMGDLSGNKSDISDTELYELLSKVENSMDSYGRGDHILTDDKAAVELLGMQVIDELIQDELGYYKQIFRTEGMEGLLNGI